MKYYFIVPFALLFAFTFSPGDALAQTAPQASGSLFTGKDAAGVITDALIKAGAGENIQVSINQARDSDIIAQTNGFLTADADAVTFDKAHNRWEGLLLLKEDGRNLAPMKLSGRYDEMTSIPVLKRRMQPGEVISESDIDWDKQPASRLRPGTVTDAATLIGQSPHHMLLQGRAIRADEIGGATVVAKGSRVTLTFKSGNIEINTLGEAMESGARGDVIKVRNISSKNIIEGTVESADRVRVHSADSDSAEAM